VNYFNEDLPSCFNLMPDDIAMTRYGLNLSKLRRLNAGLGLVCREAIVLDAVEEFLGTPELTIDDRSNCLTLALIEQSLYGLLSAQFRTELLPETYLISASAGLTISEEPVVARHYPGSTRRLLFEEGIPELVRRGFLEEL
jgi:hypothetical protein